MGNSTSEDLWVPEMPSCPGPAVCIIEAAVVIAVVFLILVGNVSNLIVLLSTRSLRNSHGYLLLSLSVADLMTGLMASLAVYPSATLQSSPDSWPYGDTVCLVAAYIKQIGITNSSITLMLLSVERYIAVVHPLRYTRVVTKKVTLVCISVVWLFSAGFFSIIFAGFPEHLYFSTLYVCLPQLFSTNALAFFLLGSVTAPMLVIIITSCAVGRKLRAGFQGSRDADTREYGTGIKVKTFRMVQVMTATFILCYVPFFTLLFVSLFAFISMPQVVAFGVYWLLLANSFFNTLIYFKMNTTFRARIHELLGYLAAKVSPRLTSEKHDSHSTRESSYTKSYANSFTATDGNSLATSTMSMSIHCHDSNI
ncbi:tachykinin-like peptides receptor 86C [Acanthaster planci]|uniref:Tachykinin-like peptides receptor 86C n=1 Tax=Acanthaster planci TaxID=133434 RepID=A0A8B7ZHA3_ACAPL|nr:tachykinin-like peptides receptor 86C [Acanthaster planci]